MLGRRAARRIVAWVGRRRRRAGEPHGLVLMYHRIAEVAVDPWGLAVTPAHFESQVEELVQHADIVPLTQLARSLRRGRGSRPVVAITFDDAYVDNLDVAKPVLERRGAPATVFVPTGFVGTDRAFWWDRLAETILVDVVLAASLELGEAGEAFHWHDPRLARDGRVGALARRRLHDALWRWLHALPEPGRETALARLAKWVDKDPPALSARPMSWDELRGLVAGGVVEVGAHSVHHPLLTRLSADQKAREIMGSRQDCAEMLGLAPAAFAFPNGDLDRECVALVREAGFSLACTSQQELVWAAGDAFLTPRLAVPDVEGRTLVRWLHREWLA